MLTLNTTLSSESRRLVQTNGYRFSQLIFSDSSALQIDKLLFGLIRTSVNHGLFMIHS